MPDAHLTENNLPGRWLRTALAAQIARLERHLALPGDDETLRRRKVVAFFAGLAGVNTALLFAVLYFVGGAPLLGVNGICIIGHGSSDKIAAKNGILQAVQAVEHRVNEAILDGVRKCALQATPEEPAT